MVGRGELGVGSFRSCFYDFSQAGLEECSAPGQRSLSLGQSFPAPRPVSLQPSAPAGGNSHHSWAWEAAGLRRLFPRLSVGPSHACYAIAGPQVLPLCSAALPPPQAVS